MPSSLSLSLLGALLVSGEGDDTLRGGAAIDLLIGDAGASVIRGDEEGPAPPQRAATTCRATRETTGWPVAPGATSCLEIMTRTSSWEVRARTTSPAGPTPTRPTEDWTTSSGTVTAAIMLPPATVPIRRKDETTTGTTTSSSGATARTN
jgi:Ca2+-binding RTX toxin-like protein